MKINLLSKPDKRGRRGFPPRYVKRLYNLRQFYLNPTHMKNITVTAAFYGGTGFVIFDGEGIPKHKRINATDPDLTLTASQTPGYQNIDVAGQIPAGDATTGGKVTIEVTDDTGKVLAKADDNTFEPTDDGSGGKVYTFQGAVVYEL